MGFYVTVKCHHKEQPSQEAELEKRYLSLYHLIHYYVMQSWHLCAREFSLYISKKYFESHYEYPSFYSFSKKVISFLFLFFLLHDMHLGSREQRGEICFFAIKIETLINNVFLWPQCLCMHPHQRLILNCTIGDYLVQGFFL